MSKIFVSYRHTQGHFVDRLVQSIRNRIEGSVFVDLTGIKASDFANAITEEIRSCDIFILVMSADTFAPDRIVEVDDWIVREVSLALSTMLHSDPSKPLPIVLVFDEDCEPPKAASLPERIRGIATKQGIRFRREFFDESVDHLIDHCTAVAPEAIVRKAYGLTSISGHFEIGLKQSVREAIERLTRELVRMLELNADQSDPAIRISNAWSASEGLLALLYTSSSALAAYTMGQLNAELLASVARKLVGIDNLVRGGGIPAAPDFQIDDRGVVDSTAKVVSALSCLRLYMLHHSYSAIGTLEPVALRDIEACIARLCEWLRANQNDDGGWGLWFGSPSRVTATAFAVIAFVDAGIELDASHMQNALTWLEATQKPDGSWALTPDLEQSDVTSTAFAVAALSMLSASVTAPSIQRAVRMLETNTNWADAVHTVAIDSGETRRFISMTYAAEPRAIYALLLTGSSPTSLTIVRALQRLSEAELPTGGWARKSSANSKMDVWYTYVVVECINAWFTHCNQISYLVRLSRSDQALAGLVRSYTEKQSQVDQLLARLQEIQRIASSGPLPSKGLSR